MYRYNKWICITIQVIRLGLTLRSCRAVRRSRILMIFLMLVNWNKIRVNVNTTILIYYASVRYDINEKGKHNNISGRHKEWPLVVYLNGKVDWWSGPAHLVPALLACGGVGGYIATALCTTLLSWNNTINHLTISPLQVLIRMDIIITLCWLCCTRCPQMTPTSRKHQIEKPKKLFFPT